MTTNGKATKVQQAVEQLGVANLAGGVLALTGPVVTGNQDRIINIHPGKLFGVASVNGMHGLLHVGMGLYALKARHSHRESLRYMRVTAGLFGIMTAMGWHALRDRPDGDTIMMMGMAVDRLGTSAHAVLAAIGLLYSRD